MASSSYSGLEGVFLTVFKFVELEPTP